MMLVLCCGEMWVPKGYGPLLSNWPDRVLVYCWVSFPALLCSYYPLFVYSLPGQCTYFQKTEYI